MRLQAKTCYGTARPYQVDPLNQVFGWSLSEQEKQEIDAIINSEISEPIGPEFMAPPSREKRVNEGRT